MKKWLPDVVKIRLAGRMDLVANPDWAREQIAKFLGVRPRKSRERILKVRVDMRSVETLDACAVLNLVAHSDRIAQMSRVRIRGNSPPKHTQAFRVLRSARFHEYMSVRGLQKSEDPAKTMTIRQGDTAEKLNPSIWGPLSAFLHEGGLLTKPQAGTLYSAFGEAIENVRQHAYRGEGLNRWYALAIRPEPEKPAQAVIVDLGVGIPSSIRRTKIDGMVARMANWVRDLKRGLHRAERILDRDIEAMEDIEHMTARLEVIRGSDPDCVRLASMGERTESASPERGTGLNMLRQAVVDTSVGRLHVLSGRAGVTWNHGIQDAELRAHQRLLGTTICLEIEPASEDADA